ncbi:MAG: hypothetical protein ETSY1_09645 [Candidatus Entotheonella factor]|uniref:NarX-like N-terminal domain-containing protein n=1 Tax=Entotheonella factor TaxID=1429438 RepID=W4LTV1_ENTF1|nr:MAG: hypothetical protein ETSY1_09645 [Candidatus Entotheonella factor]
MLPLDTLQAKINSAGDAINQAGRQRMLTQRIVKAYALTILGDNKDQHQKELQSAIKLFESQLADLQEFAPTDDVKRSIAKVQKFWPEMKAIVTAPPTRSKVEELRSVAEDTLSASHDVVLALEDTYNSSAAQIVNLSGRQRMLSQRMANLYMLKALGFEKSRYKSDMRQAMSEFNGALKELRQFERNTPEIRKSLMQVYTQFEVFKQSIKADNKELIPNLIATASSEILVKMNELTGIYADMAH